MTKEELIETATGILSRVHQKDMGYGIIVDVVNESDEKLLVDWIRQLELYLLNVTNQRVVDIIDANSQVLNGDKVSKKRLQFIVDVLQNYKEK